MTAEDVGLELQLRAAVTAFCESGTPIPADLVLDAADSLHREHETSYDTLLADYNLVIASRDAMRETLQWIADGHTPPNVAPDAARARLHQGCGTCGGTGRVTDTEGHSWPCYS